LDPLRIAAVPGVTLDVVVKKQSGKNELSLESLKEALFGTQQESTLANSTPTSATTATQTTAVQQIPTGDSVVSTVKNSTNIDKPTAVATPPPPPYRGPHNQASSPTTASGEGPLGDRQVAAQPQEGAQPQKVDAPKKADIPQEPEAPPKRTPTVAQRFAEAELKAKLGDRNAQFELGEMYEHGHGTEQSISQAFEWYGKAANQGLIVAQYTVGML
ncbi:hypothetical protein BGZ95_008265, partial [Linnemannia exigua]